MRTPTAIVLLALVLYNAITTAAIHLRSDPQTRIRVAKISASGLVLTVLIMSLQDAIVSAVVFWMEKR